MPSFHQERDSFNYEANMRRPKLSRASTTRPSITAQNAIGESLAAPHSPERATDILSKVFYTPAISTIGRKAPGLLRHQMENIMMGHGDQTITPESHNAHELLEESPSDCYFSFPSFENWDEGKDDEARSVFG
ncbi:hypothetical protein PT974_04237 [Cladobotryum mycophilum]|uniref:Uncharacterized protein n=1 Tax=Cladobotryum mycophilum TaxID=491253 RepID=A0ABR0SUL3_9HYPO